MEEWNIDTKKASGLPRVALDLVGAGEGELVMCVNGSSARQTEQTDKRPVDMAIVGIVDQVEMNGGVCYKKYPSETGKAEQKEEKKEQKPEKAEPEPKAETETPAPEKKPEPAKPRPRMRPEPLILPGPAKPVREEKPGPVPTPVAPAAVEEDERVRGRQVDLSASEQFNQLVSRSGRQNR